MLKVIVIIATSANLPGMSLESLRIKLDYSFRETLVHCKGAPIAPCLAPLNVPSHLGQVQEPKQDWQAPPPNLLLPTLRHTIA